MARFMRKKPCETGIAVISSAFSNLPRAIEERSVRHPYPSPDPRPQTSRRSGRVLVVDDIEGNIVLLRHLLEPDGYEVIAGRDGRAALDLVAREKPDVIICDIRMPHHDGFEVCRRLKADPETRLIPIVLMTATSEQDDRIRALDA